MKKILFVSLASLLLLTGCGRLTTAGEAEDITLTIWEDNKNIEVVTAIADDFARYYAFNYPNAPKLKFEFVPHSEKSSVEDLVLAGPAGTGPDVLAFVHDTLEIAVDGDLLAKNRFADKIRATHSAEAARAASLDGVMYGFPITSESQILIYRPSRITAVQAENVETIINDAAAKLVWDVFEGYYSFGLMNDALLYGEDGETVTGAKRSYLDFATPGAIANVAYARQQFKGNANLIIPGSSSGTTDIEGLSLFLSGDADAIIVAPYFWASAKSQFSSDVAMSPLPKVNGETMRPFSGYKLYGVSRYSKYPALAQELADFLTSEWAQAMRLRDKSLLPTVTSLTERLADDTIVVDSWRMLAATRITVPTAVVAEARIFQASLEQSVTMPKITRFAAFWIAYANNMKALWEEETLTEAELIVYLENITQNM